MIIRKILGKKTIKKVAAYARVSTVQEDQNESFETQVNYYTQYIKSVPKWKFVKVYADHGWSGSKADNRPGFQQMIEDAYAGKIDIILVKSISRFTRNAVEAQEYVHKLKALNVEVRFEKEGISTFDSSSEMIFSMMAAVAQEEIHSMSEKVQWTIHRLMAQGIYHIGNNHVLGYDEIDGELKPNKDAWIVKTIFEAYADGKTSVQIAKLLKSKGAKSLRKKGDLSCGVVKRMLRTVLYVGDRHLQQTAPYNYLTHKPDTSKQYVSRYIRNDHEGIVTRDLWDTVQRRLAAEKQKKEIHVHTRTFSHFLYGKLFCVECGKPYVRRTTYAKDKIIKYWKCTSNVHYPIKKRCNSKTFHETVILEAIAKKLGIDTISEMDCDKVERVELCKDGTIIVKVCETEATKTA
jgi:site-specific DNA recombinase